MNPNHKKMALCVLTSLFAVVVAVSIWDSPAWARQRYVYWPNFNWETGTSIGRANIDGSGATQNWINGCTGPAGVAVHESYVYWTNRSADTIGRANLDGSDVNQSWITGCSVPYLLSVTPKGSICPVYNLLLGQ